MKVVLINKSDCLGGAAVVTQRLMLALRAEGVDAKMLVMKSDVAQPEPSGQEKQRIGNITEDQNIIEYGNSKKGKFYFLAERLGIFLRNKFSRENLFKVSTANWGFDISKHPLVQEADAILINWINQGAMSLDGVEALCELGKPVIWTMHDMWQCTGICHHALECNRYKAECGSCQFLKSGNEKDLSNKIFVRKKVMYLNENLHFVAVSNWLASRCAESELMKKLEVSVIHNAFPIEEFDYVRVHTMKQLPEDKKIVVMGAARLDDSIKGFEYAIDSLNEIADNRKDLASKLHIVFYGTIRNEELLKKIRLPYTFLGKLDSKDVIKVYQNSDVVMSTSLYETLPGTLIEGAAAGCVPVTFGHGGQTDIVEHLKTGYIAEYLSPKSVADGIEWALSAEISREQLHENIKNRFASAKIARDYIDLISRFAKK